MNIIKGSAWLIALTVIASSVFQWFDMPRPALAQVGNSDYPAGAIAVGNSGTGTTAAVATLPASPGRTTYVCGVDISSITTTAGTVTIAGVIGGTQNIVLPATAGPIIVPMTPCFPATGPNTTIVVTGAFTAGTAAAINARGYQVLDR